MTAITRLIQIVCSAAASGDVTGRVRLVSHQIDTSTGAPDEIMVVPWGKIDGANGMFLVDDEAAASIINAFNAHGVDLPIDKEHQTLGGKFASPDGSAPAAGWITSLRALPDVGIMGVVKWTEAGRFCVANGEYRYVSPVVMIGAEDRRAYSLHSVGLTNKPAIPGMTPLVNSEQQADAAGGVDSSLAELEAALPGIEDGRVKPETLVPMLRNLVEQVKQLAGSMAASTKNEILANGCRQGEMIQLQLANRTLRCDMLIMQNSNKLPPYKDKWFRDWHAMDPASAKAWLEGTPTLVHTARDAIGGANCGAMPNPDRGALIVNSRLRFREQQEGCRAMGRRMVCTEQAFVNTALRDAGHPRMTGDEIKQFAILG